MNQARCRRHEAVHSRREFLEKSAFGFGALALAHLIDKESAFGSVFPGTRAAAANNPLAAKPPHFTAKARSVVLIFLQGGPSHVDTFDPKPTLNRLDGQLLPPSFQSEGLNLQNLKASEAKLMGSRFAFKRYGKSGLEMSDLFQRVGQYADDLAVIRSCYHDLFIHGPALNLLYTGSNLEGHPSVGSWVLYGLGSASDNLPAYIAITEGNLGSRSRKSFRSGFLPAVFQGTLLRAESSPIMNLSPPPQFDVAEQRMMLDQINVWNWRYQESRTDDSRLSARISNYELAFRMQAAAPELIDISKEPPHVRQMYGLDETPTAEFGRICLLGRRMVERGVRFVQLISTDWDGHGECDKNHLQNSRKVDKPIAALIGDLKQRGLLESTLIVMVGEFGRTPVMQGNLGRDHSPYGFSACLAGGGIRGGKVIGATDELGFRAVEDKIHVHDLHATMLSLLGLDHKKLTYFFQGRDRRLTDVGGENDLAQRLIKA
ncbi:MAG: DUF1501 domain-containing protein [Acidimicrobiia bacterium]|nr:DUF1501 domain-containing protein [Acidimicrobiia bacterium]